MKDKKYSEVILNIIILFLGLFLVLWADKLTSIVSVVLGSFGVLYGLVAFISYFRNKDRNNHDTLVFIFGIIILVIGLIFIFRVDFLKELVSFVIGIYIFLTSILKLQEVSILSKKSNVKLTSSFVLAILGIIIGIMCIIGKFLIPDMIIRFIGIMMIVYSVINVINIIIIKKKG